VLCRIGGEEFAVILPGTALDEAAGVAERVRRTIAAGPGPEAERVTVSLGVAEAPGHASSARELAACADHALLEAKAGGKNRVQVFGGIATEAGRTGNGGRPGGPRATAEPRCPPPGPMPALRNSPSEARPVRPQSSGSCRA